MVKPLSFKGDKKKSKKRKRNTEDTNDENPDRNTPSTSTGREMNPNSATEQNQTWVSASLPTDIAGPVVLVLPTSPPTCIACDANGKVYASEVGNMIEGDARTAEPHDVRQVWVATKVAGTDGLNFKGHHGKYLSCDKYGFLSATSSAVSAFESFIAIAAPDSPEMFSFQICGGDMEAFLSVKESDSTSSTPEIRGDATAISFSTTFRVRMQARFKPKSKSAGDSQNLERISRKELEEVVGRKLEEHEVKRLRKARKAGNYHEEILDVRVKGKHDKFAC